MHEVADIVRPVHHRQRRVDLFHGHAHGLGLVAVDVQLQLRRLFLACEHHFRQCGVLGRGGQQLLARLGQGLIAQASTVLRPEV
ncbi:hypothetical protein G6F22_021858 [Rhizopus arrhizus]|nr:hypothetical protein G6F22_021858 [Rhizopus arrhizus]